jgi:hypothetical protein
MPFCAASAERSYSRNRQILCKYPAGPTPARRLLEASSERVPNPLAGQSPLDPKVSDLAVPFYTGAARVRRSRTLRLTEPNMAFEYSGRSALIGSFEYNGP